jgi:hypothetical protein
VVLLLLLLLAQPPLLLIDADADADEDADASLCFRLPLAFLRLLELAPLRFELDPPNGVARAGMFRNPFEDAVEEEEEEGVLMRENACACVCSCSLVEVVISESG